MDELYHDASQLSLFSDVDYIELQQLTLFDPENPIDFPQASKKLKRCSKCKEYKGLDEFYRSKNAIPDGFDHNCKDCRKEYNINYRKEHGDPRSLDPERREAHNRQRREKHLRENPPPVPTRPGHKFCNECHVEKPFSAFNKSAGIKKDGYAGKCRVCQRDQWHNRAPEEIREQRARRSQYEHSIRDISRTRDRERNKTEHRQNYGRTRYTKRRARVSGAYIEKVDYKRILERDGYFCYICEQEILSSQRLTFDHIIPLFPRSGDPIGMHTEDNLKPTHHECNSRKSNRRFEDLTDFDKRGPDN